MIPLIKPYITEDVKRRLCAVLDSGYLTEGTETREFEAAIAQYTGAKRALAVTSCTTGLELALRALGIGPGDEVIVPDYTYPATAAVVRIVGATAVIVDVDPDTMLIDYDAAERAITASTRAIIPVSLFGNPLDWNRLDRIKADHNLHIVEDAACALGSSYGSRMTGTLADISVFSHHPRKFITTGEGGTITTDNDLWADWMSSYKHFGIGSAASRSATSFERIGTNYKLSNLLAAVGLSQMMEIDELLQRRRDLAEAYRDKLQSLPKVRLPATTEGGRHSYQSFCVFVEDRDEVMAGMRGQGIETQIGTYSLHMQKGYSNEAGIRIKGDMAGSARAFAQTLVLPLYHTMTESDQDKVLAALDVLTR